MRINTKRVKEVKETKGDLATRLRTPLITLFLFFAAWIPRVVALGAFVTVDERKWLARSANFYYALSHGDLVHTFQREHPGVTVMWAGMLGFVQKLANYPSLAPGYFGWDREEIEAWLHANTQVTPLSLLEAGRWWIVLGVALLLTFSFFPLRRLLGEKLAVLAVLFLAWMPWSVALSRELHPDGYVSGFIFVALVFFTSWLYAGQRWSDLIVSGVVMGLAWLTKTPAAFLVPTGAVLIALEVWRQRRHARPTADAASWRTLAIGYVVWGVVATITFFVLWPTMWVDPLGAFVKISTEMEAYVEGHVNPNFFLGRAVSDPGLFFYPIAYFFRITPATLVGLLAAAVAAARGRAPFDRPLVRRTASAMVVFALIFTAFMSIPAKKFDRYLLPAFLALDVVTALGWVAVGHFVLAWFARRKAELTAARARIVQVIVAAIALIPLHGLFTAIHYPYYLTYFNPLAGGSWTAPRAMIIGWGEGIEQAAQWLNQQPGAESLRVVSAYADGPFSYYFNGQPVGVGYGSAISWLDTDFVVLYINQIQRDIPSKEAMDFFRGQTPVHTVGFRGIELARVYDMRSLPLPAFTGLNVAAAANFGDKLRLLAHDVERLQVEPGATVQTTFYLQSLAAMEINYNLVVRLVAPDGSELWRADGWPWGAPTRDWPLREVRPDGHPVVIPSSAPPGLYKLTISFYDPDSFDALPVLDVNSGDLIDASTRDVALLRVGSTPSAALQLPSPWQFDRYVALSGVTLPTAALAPGDQLNLALQWDSVTATATDYTAFVHVVGADGAQVAQQDKQPLNGFAPMHTWAAGQRVVDDFAIPLPETLDAGDYELWVGLYDRNGVRLGVSQAGAPSGDSVAIGRIQVKK